MQFCKKKKVLENVTSLPSGPRGFDEHWPSFGEPPTSGEISLLSS